MALSALATAASAGLMDPVINKIFVNKDIGRLYGICLAICGVFFLKSISVYLYKLIMNDVETSISQKISKDLFDRLIYLKLDDLSSMKTGQIMTYFSSDVKNIKMSITALVVNAAKEFLTILFLVGLMFYKSPVLSCIALFGFPIAFYPLVKLTKKLRKVYRLFQESTSRVNIFLQNIFDGIRTVKSFCQEEFEKKEMDKILSEIKSLEIKAGKIGFIGSPLMEFVGGLAASLVIMYGGYKVINGEMTAGSFFAFLTALLMLYKPAKSTSNLGMSLQAGYISIKRIFDILVMPIDLRSDKGRKDVDLGMAKIKFSDLTFGYEDCFRNSAVLNGIDFTINQGEKVAFVGESGGGKSTIVRLLLKFYKVESGKIFLNDVDINEINTSFVRKNISYVSQDVSLFDGTILSNLTYGIDSYTDESLVAALKAANIEAFVQSLPNGLRTKVGHMGGEFSAGQRQRIIIARAILKNTPIVILDEATSALDNKTQKDIQSAFDALMQGKTTIMIAHRLQTVVDCDKIFFLEAGKIKESGIHADLIADSNSDYYKMWHSN